MMEEKKRSLLLVVVVASILSLTTVLYGASSDLEFFKGKTITYIVSTKPGGGYDTYGRVICKHMQKYIPGATIIVKNVPGAGNIIGANEIFFARPDGLTMGTFNTGLIYAQIIGQEGIKFDLAKYSWIGKASSDPRLLIVSIKSPYKTLKDVIESKEPLKMSTAGVGTLNHNETLIVAEALKANLKPIPGYMGREDEMAMMRGEVTGTMGSYSGLVGFIKSKECRVLLQLAAKKHKDLPDVPLASELKISESGSKLMSLVVGNSELGRFTAAAPNLPPGRLEVLRNAYKSALTDPELLKEAQKVGLDITPAFGEDVAKMVKEAIHQPAENMALLKKIVTLE
jgi:tripartite-type tricarboxylate transporter receptor subunit TctC